VHFFKLKSSLITVKRFAMNNCICKIISNFRKNIYVVIAMLIVSLSFNCGVAREHTFKWKANPEPLIGYKLYYKKGKDGVGPTEPFDGTGIAEGDSPIVIGKVNEFKVTGLDDFSVYHFALKAYNEYGESEFTSIVTLGPNPEIKKVLPN